MSVRKRIGKKRDTWQYDFMVRGVRFKGRIPEARTRAQAVQVETQMRQAVFDGRYGRQAGTESFEKFTKDIFLKWARDNKRSWKTDELYAETLWRFFRGKAFCDITPMLVEKYKRERKAGVTIRGTARHGDTVNRELALLSKIFSMAVENGYASDNPCRRVKRFAVDNKRERVLSDEEEARLLAALTGRREALRPIVIFALNTGMRRGEILKLRWEWVDLNTGQITLPREVTKAFKERVVPLNPVAREVLLGLRRESARVFTGYGSERSFETNFNTAVELAQIENLRFHDLRHTFATRLGETGADPFDIRDLLGHATIEMANYYTHTTPESRRRAVESLTNRLTFVPKTRQQAAS